MHKKASHMFWFVSFDSFIYFYPISLVTRIHSKYEFFLIYSAWLFSKLHPQANYKLARDLHYMTMHVLGTKLPSSHHCNANYYMFP